MNNTKTIGRPALSLVVVVALVTSMVGAPLVAMPVAAQEDSDAGGGLDVCDPSRVSSWIIAAGTGGLSGAYCIVSGLFESPEDASTSVELEEGAYVQHGTMQELYSQIVSDYNAHSDEYETIAYYEAEKKIIEARYNDETKSVARSSARLAGSDSLASVEGDIIEGYDEIYTEAFVWAQAVASDTDASDNTLYIEVVGSGTNANSYDTVELTEGSRLVTGNVTLLNGDSIEVATTVENISIPTQDEPQSYDSARLVLIQDTPSSTVDVEYLNESGDVIETQGYDGLRITANDPNGGGEEHIGTLTSTVGADSYKLGALRNDLRQMESDVLTDSDTRVDEVYTELAAGELNPADYYGPREFYSDYGSAMETSVAAQLYFHQQVGYDTAPDMTMFVNDSGETYEGGVLVDSAETAPLVYDETPNPLSSTGDVTLDSHSHKGLLTFDENNETSVTFVDNSDYDTANLSIDVINVDNETVAVDGSNITATFSESDMQDKEFVIFRAVHDDGTTVTESGTYVLFSDETTTEIRGFVTGDDYSGYSMLYLTGSGDIEDRQLSNSWTLERNLNADGNDKAVAVTHEGVDTSFTGTSAKDRIETQQTIKDAVGERDDITTTPAGGSSGDGISSLWAGLGGFALGIIVIMGVGFFLLVLYLVGRVTSVA